MNSRSPLFALLLAFSTLLSGCASTAMTTRDIYANMLGLRPIGFRCYPNEIADQAFRENDAMRERMIALRPWLEEEVGKSQLDAIDSDFESEMALIHFNSCPSEVERERARAQYRAWLRELENRSR